jgi:tRNA dimethylallyltransferase
MNAADIMSTERHAGRSGPGAGRKPLVVLLGPTAVGKTKVAIELAAALGTDVLTADSRQVFRGMDIGMDKPTPAERRGVPHRLIDLVEPDAPFNVGDYRRLAVHEITRLHEEGRLPLVVGGTGLYIRALVRGLWEGPAADWALRHHLMQLGRSEGPDYLYRELSRVDPTLAATLHPRDEAKIIRGLEIYTLTGRPLSECHQEHRFDERPYRALLLGLAMPREVLYRRIERRVDQQLSTGLVEETRRLLAAGYGRDLGSMKGLGYRQIAGHLAGEYDYVEAVRRLKRDTRHFAKRQMTWFRKEPDVVWVEVGEQEPPNVVARRLMGRLRAFVDAEPPVIS